MILDKFSRQSFLVDATSGELNPPGWTHGSFGLFFDLKLERWVLTHLPSKKVFQFHFLSIESACEAVLELETLDIDWSQKSPETLGAGVGHKVVRVLKRKAEPIPQDYDDVFRRLNALLEG